MRIAGHSSVKVPERQVHPSAEAFEGAFERLEGFNGTAPAIENQEDRKVPATVSATLEDLTPTNQQEIALIQ